MLLFAPPSGLSSGSRLLKRGERLLEPDVYLTALEGRPAVVKDYRRYRWTPLAPLARWLVRREARILRRLQGWRHAPTLLGTVGGLWLAMEFVPGDTLGAHATLATRHVFEQLQAAVAHLHREGITHNDLHAANVLVSGGVPVLIDFTAALRLPGPLRHGALARQLRRGDLKNVAKLRQRLTGDAPDPALAAQLAEPGWVRALRAAWKRLYRVLKPLT
ncbi:protein kinase domain-containing protein [Vulcaniibacterium gelatinicum]|uniref:protein kinase domain-containing protein n=1 Tax=Vulcaniibacterium gelatinicum TaxID=2598725 RepID=UPI0011C9EDB8|nr:phosphotransferase [Vulcaniibacterium gelatinicum]